MAVEKHRPGRRQVKSLKQRHLRAAERQLRPIKDTETQNSCKHSHEEARATARSEALTMELFPPPLGPTKATVSPGLMSRSRPFRTCTAGLLGYENVTPRSASAPLISAGTSVPDSDICAGRHSCCHTATA